MIGYKYKKRDNKFTENGHTMFEEDVLQRLKRLAHLEEQIKQGQLLPIDSVSGMFSSEELEQAYKDGVKDALAKGYGTFDEENYC